MKIISTIASFFYDCPLRKMPGVKALLGNAPRWRNWSGVTREIEVCPKRKSCIWATDSHGFKVRTF